MEFMLEFVLRPTARSFAVALPSSRLSIVAWTWGALQFLAVFYPALSLGSLSHIRTPRVAVLPDCVILLPNIWLFFIIF